MVESVAVISDIHSNIYALDAVLARIAAEKLELVVNLGDSLLGPIEPALTAMRLMDCPNLVNIMGNGDRLLLERQADSRSFEYAKPMLTPEILQWIADFRPCWSYEGLLFCHGTPFSNETYLLEDVTELGVVFKTPEELSLLLSDVEEPLVFCGHSHVPRTVVLPDGRRVINAGSVGLPAYYDELPAPHAMESLSPHARFAAVRRNPVGGWTVEHVEVPYDYERAAFAADEHGRPDYSHALRTGKALR